MKKLFFQSLVYSLIYSFFIFLIVFFFSFFHSNVYAYDVPEPTGFVNDYAQVLSEETRQGLETRLSSVSESTSGAELAVVTIQSLKGDMVENVAQEFFDTWKIGKKGVDNGVLFLIAIDDRELRIHTGYGAEGVIPDSVAGRIIRNEITPHFKNNDYDKGIKTGVDSILLYLDDPDEFQSNQDDGENTTVSEFLGMGVFGLFIMWIIGSIIVYIVSFLGRTKSWWLGGVIGVILGFLFGKTGGAIFLGIFGLVLDYILSKNYKKWKIDKAATDWKSTWGGFKGGSSSGSSSGFSGFGGGSSGGGGASGSW